MKNYKSLKNKVFFVLILLSCQNSQLFAQIKLHEQEEVFSRKNKFEQFYAAVNDQSYETFFFIKTEDSLQINQFSVGFLPKDSITVQPEINNIKSIIGARFDNPRKPRLFFTNEDYSSIYTLAVDFNTKKADSIVSFAIPNDEYVTNVFEHENAFYLLTTSKNESWLRVYTFKDKPKPIVQTFNLEQFQIQFNDKTNWDFKQVIRQSNSFEFPYGIEYIKNDFQPPLMQAAARRKMYVDNQKIYFSFDYNTKQTHWILLDLKEQTTRFYQTPLPDLVSKNTDYKTCNSFWHDNKVYGIKTSKDSIKVEILDFETKEIIRKLTGSAGKINFKNTDLFYNPGNKNAFKKYKSAKPFLKKTKSSYWGISVFYEQDGILLNIGAIKENPNTTFLAADIFINALVIASGSSYTYNPILLDFAEKDFKSSFFETKLDKQFIHHLGELKPNAEHEINFFLSENPKFKNVYVFKRLSFYVLSYYDSKEEKIYFRKFD
uniref:hypothetical protein n=1 Tax=Flavobacterium sp. TaxID=239 RepID=UPI00404AB874